VQSEWREESREYTLSPPRDLYVVDREGERFSHLHDRYRAHVRGEDVELEALESEHNLAGHGGHEGLGV